MPIERTPPKSKQLQLGECRSRSNTFFVGGWLSSVKDMAKWEAALCREMILNKSTLEQMWSHSESKRKNEREYGFTQGLGWRIPKYSKRVVSHNGSIKGFAAICLDL